MDDEEDYPHGRCDRWIHAYEVSGLTTDQPCRKPAIYAYRYQVIRLPFLIYHGDCCNRHMKWLKRHRFSGLELKDLRNKDSAWEAFEVLPDPDWE